MRFNTPPADSSAAAGFAESGQIFYFLFFSYHLLKVFWEQRRSWKEVVINARRPPDLAGSVSGEFLYPNSFLSFFFFFSLTVHSGLSYRASGGVVAGEPGGRVGGRPCPLRLI
jgi:hypothetical protein